MRSDLRRTENRRYVTPHIRRAGRLVTDEKVLGPHEAKDDATSSTSGQVGRPAGPSRGLVARPGKLPRSKAEGPDGVLSPAGRAAQDGLSVCWRRRSPRRLQGGQSAQDRAFRGGMRPSSTAAVPAWDVPTGETRPAVRRRRAMSPSPRGKMRGEASASARRPQGWPRRPSPASSLLSSPLPGPQSA